MAATPLALPGDANTQALDALKQSLINEGAVFVSPNPNITNVQYTNVKNVGQEISQFTIDGKTVNVIKNDKNSQLLKKVDIQFLPGEYGFDVPGVVLGVSGVRIVPEASVKSSDGQVLTVQNLQMVDFMMLSNLYDTNYLFNFSVLVDAGISFRLIGDSASQIETKALLRSIRQGNSISVSLSNGFAENSNNQQPYIDEIFKNFNNQIPDNLKDGIASLSLEDPTQINNLWTLYYKGKSAGIDNTQPISIGTADVITLLP